MRYERNIKIKTVINKPLVNDNVCFDYNKTGYYIRDYFKAKKIVFIYKVIKKEGAFLSSKKEDLILLTLTLPSSLRSKTNNENLKN